jgi:transcription antitermination factor NusG
MKNIIHSTDSSLRNWFAICTRFRYEKRVRDELNKMGVNNILPITKKLKKWSDRTILVEEPVIPSYIFVCPEEKEYFKVLNIKGVINYVNISGKPSPIPLEQIMAIQAVEHTGMEHSYTTDRHPKGERVLIQSGPLKGIIGEVIQDHIKGRKMVVRIPDIGYSLVIIERSRNDLALLSTL